MGGTPRVFVMPDRRYEVNLIETSNDVRGGLLTGPMQGECDYGPYAE